MIRVTTHDGDQDTYERILAASDIYITLGKSTPWEIEETYEWDDIRKLEQWS